MSITVFYANQNKQDIGVLKGFKLDMSISMDSGNNNFEVTTYIDGVELDQNYYIYAEGSEYGGIVDTKRINTKTKTIYYDGRTWRGMLESKIIIPPSGQDYYTASGNLNAVIGQLISSFGLSELFYADNTTAGASVSDYKFYRYTDVYSGIIRLLFDSGYKLKIEFDTSVFKCKLSAVLIDDYSNQQEITSDLYDFDVSRVGNTVNHLIGLGYGELKNRLTVHKYANSSGVISNTQTLTGKDEIVAIYEYSNAQDAADLEAKTIEKFQSLIGSDKIKVTLNDIDADVGDKLTVHDELTGIEAVQYVQSKIVNIDDDTVNIQHSAKTMNVGQVGLHAETRSNSLDTYPAGSVICMNSNSNPSQYLGGTWELIDKQFSSKTFNSTSLLQNVSSLITLGSLYIVRGATSITVRILFSFVNRYNSQADFNIGTLNLASLGLDSSVYACYFPAIMNTDQTITNSEVAVLTCVMASDGVVKYYCTTQAIPAGQTVYAQWTMEIPLADRLDTACDKFYFRRLS